MAMEGNRYPITQIGVANLTHRLIEVAEHDKKYGECDVQFRKGAKVNDRVCTIIEVTHPIPRRNFLFHKAIVYVDDELNVPIRYEAYSWPKTPGGPPTLDEEYTYINLKTNVGLTDADFDIHNPSYHFKESGR
jgi:outer membrane lipoprotein-sorting protein